MADIDTMLAEVKRLDAEASAASSAPMPECNCCGDEHDECLDDCAHEQWTLRLGKALRARGEYYRTAAPLLVGEVERLRRELAATADAQRNSARCASDMMRENARLRAEVEELKARRTIAGEHAMRYGMIDGSHHKQWVIDQMLRAMLGTEYAAWVAEANADDDYAEWSEGIAP